MKQFHNHGHLRDVIVSLIYMDRVREKGECGSCPWATGEHCHVTCQRINLEKPVFHEGSLGLWKIDDDKLEQIRSQEHKKPCKNNLKSLN